MSFLTSHPARADFEKRKEYFQEMQEILIEDVPALYLAYAPVMIAHRANIKGVQAHTALAHWLFEDWWVTGELVRPTRKDLIRRGAIRRSPPLR